MSWTNEQLEAINKEGKSIIVSAGAGSGKTAVLTERVIRKIKEGTHINELLILTFTNAASREMKERIRKNISKDPSLKEELDLLDSSFITTFDSFTLSIIKKYYYLLNISSDVSPCDESLINLKKKVMLDNIIDSLYEEENPKLAKLISDFCVKDDKSIRDYILKMNRLIETKTDKYEYLSNYIKDNFNDRKIEETISVFEELLIKRIEEISNLLEEIRHYTDEDFYDKLSSSLTGLISSKTYEDILYNVTNLSMPNVPRVSSEVL